MNDELHAGIGGDGFQLPLLVAQEAAGNGQPEPETGNLGLQRRVDPVEFAENLLFRPGRNAGAVVAQPDLPASSGPDQRKVDPFSGGGVLESVVEQVVQDLQQRIAIDPAARRASRQRYVKLDSGRPGAFAAELGGCVQQLGEIGFRRRIALASRIEAAEVEDIADQAESRSLSSRMIC